MRKVYKWLHEIFRPADMQGIHIEEVSTALNDQMIRGLWLSDMFGEIQRVNLEVDLRLMSGKKDLTDLSARRRAIQDMLERVLSIRRTVETQTQRHNPRPKVEFDLDRVTA